MKAIARIEHGMKCQQCGGKLIIESTHEAGLTVRRLRKCDRCGKRITTHEKPDQQLATVHSQK